MGPSRKSGISRQDFCKKIEKYSQKAAKLLMVPAITRNSLKNKRNNKINNKITKS